MQQQFILLKIYQTSMNERLVIYCNNGHQAKRLCVEDDCTHPSPICLNQNCNLNYHNNCNISLKVDKFVDSIINKIASITLLEDPILEFYNKSIKSLNRDKEQYLKSKNILESGLTQQERKLVELINKGPVKNILPQLISRVSKSLKKEPIVTADKLDQQLAKDIAVLKEEIEDILKGVKSRWGKNSEKIVENSQDEHKEPELNVFNRLKNRFIGKLLQTSKKIQASNNPKEQCQLWNFKKFQQFNFDNKTSLSWGLEISNNGKRVKRTFPQKHIKDNHSFYAILSPSLQTGSQTKRFEFKMIGKYCNFGIGYKQTLEIIHENPVQYQIQMDGIGRGAFLLNSGGWRHSHLNYDQDMKLTDFRCSPGDIVVLEVDMCECKMQIYNKKINPQKKVVFDFLILQGNPLHALVKMWSQNEQVQLIYVS